MTFKERLSNVLKAWKQERIEEVSKTGKIQAKFSYKDGKEVTRQDPSGVFNLRSPAQRNIPPNASIIFRLGIQCNYPIQVFEARGPKQRGLRLSTTEVVDSDEEIVLRVRNDSERTELIEIGDTLARGFVLNNLDVEAVK